MKGTARKRGTDRWQIQVYAGVDARTGKDLRVTRTVATPHPKAGRKIVDKAIASLILKVNCDRREPLVNGGTDVGLVDRRLNG